MSPSNPGREFRRSGTIRLVVDLNRVSFRLQQTGSARFPLVMARTEASFKPVQYAFESHQGFERTLSNQEHAVGAGRNQSAARTAPSRVPVVVKSNETGCAYEVGCGWSTGWLIQATSGSLGGRGRRAKRSGCWV